MHKNKVWLAFLSFLGAIVLWFMILAARDVYTYLSLSAHTQALEMVWSVEQRASDKFVLAAKYLYAVDGLTLASEDSFATPFFLNPWSAEKALLEFSSKKWMVWYSPRNPLHTSLQKHFPWKSTISAGLLLAVLGYFFWLGRYVAKQ